MSKQMVYLINARQLLRDNGYHVMPPIKILLLIWPQSIVFLKIWKHVIC